VHGVKGSGDELMMIYPSDKQLGGVSIAKRALQVPPMGAIAPDTVEARVEKVRCVRSVYFGGYCPPI
jgi:hypothetical protein